jgi:hypothetical protein
VEYEALGAGFHDRGRRSEEQVELMRRLWTQELVSFEGRWHRITDAGINPLPVQRPIPVWFGGRAQAVLHRIARLGDGWFPLLPPDETAREAIELLHKYAVEVGRDPSAIGIEGRVNLAQGSFDHCAREIEKWRALGATHVALSTMRAGLPSPEAHIEAIQRLRQVLDG